MGCGRILGVWLLAVVAARAQYDAMFKASVLYGAIGDTAVRLYLAPSPHIRDAAADFIKTATGSVDVCMYELDLPVVLERLVGAHERGVKVRVAVSPEGKPNPRDKTLHDQFKEMERKKILRYTKNKSGLMHNKFMVADGATIWTGSYNLTKNDTEMNDNNAIVLTNRLLAANYTAEFEEIWAGRHGKRSSDPTPNRSITIGRTPVETRFSPEDDVEKTMVREIKKATNSIYVMAFGLSDDGIFKALSNKVAKGVNVYVLFDLELSRQRSSQSKPLKDAKATVRISSNNGQMHHKVIVIDGNVVITGSPNFSASAFDTNDENILVFSCPPLAKAFMREFTRCWLARPYIYSKWSQPVK